MTRVNFILPPGSVKHVRDSVSRMSGVLSGQVTSCELHGPPLSATMSAVVPEDRLLRVLEVASVLGAEVEML